SGECSWLSARGSRCLLSVHHQYMSGDKVGSIRCQKHGSSFQVMIAAEATKGNLVQECFAISFDRHLGHVRREPSGSNGIDLDVVNSPFTCQVLSESDNPAFAGMIPDGLEFRWCASQPSHRSDVNNLSSALRHHPFPDGLREKECAGQIRLDHLVPVLQLHILDGRAPGCTSVVDNDVDPAEA